MSTLSRPAALAALCGILSFSAGLAHADVTLERSMSVEGVGAMAFGNMSGTSRTTISGDKSRTDSDIKMQSKLIGFLARGAFGPTAEIVRLDQDKMYHLNINKKEYTETSFEQLRAQMQKMSDQLGSAEEKQRQQPSAIDQSKCEWLPPKTDVKKTGEKAQYAGYDSERVTITASQPCKDKETGAICEVALVLDEWLAPGFAESSETQRYYKAYAAKMGLDASSLQDASQRAKSMFSPYKGIWTELASKMQGLKGYPVKSSFTLALGGAQCKNAQQAQSSPESSGDSGPGGPAGLAGAMAGKLGGLFHKKKDESDAAAAHPAAPAAPVALPPGDVALMTINSQLLSVSTAPASADAFTVPADFKLKQDKTS